MKNFIKENYVFIAAGITLIISMLIMFAPDTWFMQNDDPTLEESEQKFIAEYVEENYGPYFYGVKVDWTTADRLGFDIFSEEDSENCVATVTVPRTKYNLENS